MSKKKSPFLALELDALQDADRAANKAGVHSDVIRAGLTRLYEHCWRKKTDRVEPEELGCFFTGANEQMRRALALMKFLEIDGELGGDRVKGAERLLRIRASRSKGGHASKGNLRRGTQPALTPPRHMPEGAPAHVPAPAQLLQPAASSQQPADLPPYPPHRDRDGSETAHRRPRRPRLVPPPPPTAPRQWDASTPAGQMWNARLDALRDAGATYAAVQLERFVPELVDGRLVVTCGDAFFGAWCEEQYGALLREPRAGVGWGSDPPLVSLRYPPMPVGAAQ